MTKGFTDAEMRVLRASDKNVGKEWLTIVPKKRLADDKVRVVNGKRVRIVEDNGW